MTTTTAPGTRVRVLTLAVAAVTAAAPVLAQRTVKPVLHGRHWVAVTGKPLAATAGALIFARGGNAVDATCAMLAATSTMWDTLGWGGETQALIFDPREGEVVGINALGVAPTGATVDFFHERGFVYPPEYGPLAAVTPGTPGGLIVMLAHYGTMSLAEVLEPSIQMADGYPIERAQADNMERRREMLQQWPDSARVFLPHLSASGDGDGRAAPRAGEIFRQPDLLDTLRKLVEAEAAALKQGKTREQALAAAYDRFYKGDIAEEFVRGSGELGGLITMADLDRWQVHIEQPVHTNYRGVDVYKLTSWVQGPVMLQALNILENADLKSMGYNSARYIHTLYQAMNLAFADRDFYYGDPYYPPAEPLEGLLSKDYARARYGSIDWKKNDEDARPGNPYDFQEGDNPFLDLLDQWTPIPPAADAEGEQGFQQASAGRQPLPRMTYEEAFTAGTTSIQAADADGWVRVRDPERRLDPRRDRRPHRHRHEPADAEFRARPGAQPVQPAGTRQASPRHADARHGAQGRRAVPLVRRPGRRHPGPEPAPILPQRGRVRHERPGSRRGRQHHQPPDAEFLRRPRVAAGRHRRPPRRAALGAGGTPPHGLQRSRAGPYFGTDHRDLVRPRERDHVGRRQRLRRGLRHRLVIPINRPS